jgi:hypothetical protein
VQEALTIDGALKTFTSLGGSGKPILRHFCPECGSPLSGHVVVNVGTLDDPAQMTPTVEIFCDDALSWVQLGGNMQRFAKLPG